MKIFGLKFFGAPSGEPVAVRSAVEKMKKGTPVHVLLGDMPRRMRGNVVAEVAPDILRVRITRIVDKLFSDDYEWLVGEIFEMHRVRCKADCKPDTFGWAPIEVQS